MGGTHCRSISLERIESEAAAASYKKVLVGAKVKNEMISRATNVLPPIHLISLTQKSSYQLIR